MAVYTYTERVHSVGALWEYLNVWYKNYFLISGATVGFTLTTEAGYRALLMNLNTGPDQFNVTFQVLDVFDTSLLTLRALTKTPGWRGKPPTRPAFTGAASNEVVKWRSAMVAVRRQMLAGWTGATLTATQQATLVCETGKWHAYLDYYTAHKGFDVELDGTVLYGWSAGPSWPIVGDIGPCDGMDVSPVSPPVDVSGIVEGLSDLNNSRLDVSLNNGAVVVSAVGGTNIT